MRDPRVTVHASTRLTDDVRACDLVLGGNSTVLRAFLINTCRGPVVDECALEDALASSRLAGAALVFEIEPLPADSRPRSLRNCFLAPHNANSSVMAAERVHENTIRSLLGGLAQARPVTGAVPA